MTSCTLHKLIESIESKTIIDSKVLTRTRDQFLSWMEEIQTKAPRSMCFHMGTDSILEGYKVIPELFRLPYEVCWFEGYYDSKKTDGMKFGFFCEEEKTGFVSVYVFVWLGEHKTWLYLGHAAVGIFPGSSGELRVSQIDVQNDPRLETNFLINWLAVFLSAINCSNVGRVSHDPDAKLQKARSVRGKKPLFSFWTLEFPLDQEEMERVNLGGTHASPRGHLRRGHARRLPSGHWTWVRACAVGNLSLGIVHKDYQAV